MATTNKPAARPAAPAPKAAPAARTAPPAGRPAAGKAAPGGAGNLLAKRLAAMQGKWEGAKTESQKTGGSGEINLSDGRYVTRLSNAELREGKNDSLGVVFTFTVVQGDPADIGEKASRWSGFDTDERVIYLQRDLRRLGVGVDDFQVTDLPRILKELTEAAPGVRITVKTNGEYKNVYLDKLVELDDDAVNPGGGDEPAAEDAVVDEDPPADEEVTDEEVTEYTVADAAGAEDHEEPAEEEAPAEDEEPAADAISPGDDVKLVWKKKKVAGTVKKVSGNKADVKLDGTGEMVRGIDVNELDKVLEA